MEDKETVKTFSETVTPDVYEVEIKPDDWKPNGTIVVADIVVEGMVENCIATAYINDAKIKENANNKSLAYKLIEDIFTKELFEAKTDTYMLHAKFIGPAPTETIYMEVEVLPFPDVPAAKFDLD